MRGGRLLLGIALTAALCAAASDRAQAAPGLLLGVADDSLKWTDKAGTATTLGHLRELGLRAVRITVPWHQGETRLSAIDRKPLDRAVLASFGLRIVLAVYGSPDDAPRDNIDRTQYCSYVSDLLRRYPSISDVVIWNEPNVSRFWRPQYGLDGTSEGPTDYEALLAHCYDQLHASRPGVNVIAASAPRGNDKPLAASNVSHSPVNFYRALGEAYRASGRTRPIFDTIGHNPYPDTNAERPWVRHAGNTIGQGDYDKLIDVLDDAFGGTGQPVPGKNRVSIWYMEQGFQTTIDPSKRHLYQGEETDKQALPPLLARGAASTKERLAPDQATQLADAVRLAYCQPAVTAFFNFELADEPGLGGWQSGVLWVDQTPKSSYAAFKRAVADVAAGNVDCDAYEALGSSDPGIGFSTDPKKKPPVVVVK